MTYKKGNKLEELSKKKRFAGVGLVALSVGTLASGFMLARNISGLIDGSAITGKVVATASLISRPVIMAPAYGVIMLVLCGLTYITARRMVNIGEELKRTQDNQLPDCDPNLVLVDFFEVLMNWSLNDSTAADTLNLLEKIRQENIKHVPSAAGISFRLTEDNRGVNVRSKEELTWPELNHLFKAFMSGLDVEKTKFNQIAEYLGKEDLVHVINHLD